MASHKAYLKVRDQARQAWYDRDVRLSADKCWEAIQMMPDGVWTVERFLCLQSYARLLEDQTIEPTKKDYENLETHLVRNQDEPNIFRARAALCVAIMYFHDKLDCDQAAEFLRDCIDLCGSASPEEKERFEYLMLNSDGPPQDWQLRDVFDDLKDKASKHLLQMESGETFGLHTNVQDPVRSAWGVYTRPMMVPIFGDIPTELMERRLASGGATCDCCGVARGSTDRKSLLVCGKCKMGYYCSKECQMEQWKRRGHKKACRKPNEFQAGDIVRLKSVGALLRLERLFDTGVGDDTHSWCAFGANRSGQIKWDVVKESDMIHIRPADIV